MSRVFTHMTMSLDGFIADPNDQVDALFDWYQAGDVAVHIAGMSFHVDQASAEFLREFMSNTGALITGRRLFDITNGWGDTHPVGAPVVVVTHEPPADTSPWPTTTFVDSVEAAIDTAKQIANGRYVNIASANIIQQAIKLGLVDEVCVSLVPVLLGEGIPYFGPAGRVALGDPTIITGRRATHLRYSVHK